MAEDTKETIKEAEIITAEAVKVKNKPYSKSRLLNKLTHKQKRFVKEYIKNPGISLAQAALNAGYDCKSRQMASQTGHAVMKNPAVQSALKQFVLDGNLDTEAIKAYADILHSDLSMLEGKDKIGLMNTKLKVVEEINKIQGNYAPKRTENKSARVTFTIPKRNND